MGDVPCFLLQQQLQRVAVLDHASRLQREAINSLKQHHMSTTMWGTFVLCSQVNSQCIGFRPNNNLFQAECHCVEAKLDSGLCSP